MPATIPELPPLLAARALVIRRGPHEIFHPMWIVRLALDRPYTFVVLALLIFILSPVMILRTPTDIFPSIDIPVVAVAWNYSGLNVVQLGLSGKGMSEQQLNDASQNFVRPQLITVPGAVVPNPYGGKQRQMMINLDQRLLQQKGISATEVLSAVNAQNLVIPSGSVKIGAREYDVRTNAAARSLQELANLPIKQVGATTLYVRDVATVSDGF